MRTASQKQTLKLDVEKKNNTKKKENNLELNLKAKSTKIKV